MSEEKTTSEVPDHPVGSRWIWLGDGADDEDANLIVTKVTKKTITMMFDNGETVQFLNKEKTLTSKKIIRRPDES